MHDAQNDQYGGLFDQDHGHSRVEAQRDDVPRSIKDVLCGLAPNFGPTRGTSRCLMLAHD